MSSRIHHKAFEEDGVVILDSLLSPARTAEVEAALDALDLGSAGTRNLLEQSWCRSLVGWLKEHPALSALLPPRPVAAQCTLFEKSSERNWLVPMHQDLSIPVRERREDLRLAGWSEKEGVLYVQLPTEVLEDLVAVRIHIDDCGPDHGPLRVVPGSHRLGRLSEKDIPAVRRERGERDCVVGRGGTLIMRPLLVHGSSKAVAPNRRRVLHFLFGPAELPLGLEWRHKE
jgi:Phytanoyl-CoA dioxygenase (PhyH)